MLARKCSESYTWRGKSERTKRFKSTVNRERIVIKMDYNKLKLLFIVLASELIAAQNLNKFSYGELGWEMFYTSCSFNRTKLMTPKLEVKPLTRTTESRSRPACKSFHFNFFYGWKNFFQVLWLKDVEIQKRTKKLTVLGSINVMHFSHRKNDL